MFSSIQSRLAFGFLPQVGPAAYWKLVEQFGSIDIAFEHGLDVMVQHFNDDAADLIRAFSNYGERSALFKLVTKEQERCDALAIDLISDDDSRYPRLLRETSRCPPILYVKGNANTLALPQIAIVGSRNPSPIGQELAFEFAQQLAGAGFSITSGLALGIDACAHRGALASDDGVESRTIAVLGSALNCMYPKRNRRLADDIVASGGAIVSEFALDTEALPQHFPQRNRIVSGLSCGTLVVEAALKSGSLITARCALQQNREVFAIPGSIRNPVSRGCNAMIKSGAKLVETPMDVICELESLIEFTRSELRQKNVTPTEAVSSVAHNILLDAVGFEPTSIDQIAERSFIPLEQLLPSLLQLELDGRIENTGLGYIRL